MEGQEKFVKQYVTQPQIEEAIKLSLEMAKDTKLDAHERGLALNRVFRSYHNNVSDRLNEDLLEMHDEAHQDVSAKADKAIDAVKRLSKRDKPVWEQDDEDDEQE